MRRRLAGWLVLAALASASNGHALCGKPDIVDSIPPDAEQEVPTNTPLLGTYELGAAHHGESVLVARDDGPPRELAARYQSALRTLAVSLPTQCAPELEDCADPDFPGGQLRPNTRYQVTWPGLGSIDDEAQTGAGAVVQFVTGDGPDTSSPGFSGLSQIRWDFEREFDSCSDTESERYLFDLEMPAPDYAASVNLLKVNVFQTRGPTLELDANRHQKPELVHSERYTGKEWLRVKRPIADGVGRVCFSAFLEAPSGLISGGGNEEVCTRTLHPPFFDGCSVRPANDSEPWVWGMLSGLAWGVLQSRRRRHPPRSGA